MPQKEKRDPIYLPNSKLPYFRILRGPKGGKLAKTLPNQRVNHLGSL